MTSSNGLMNIASDVAYTEYDKINLNKEKFLTELFWVGEIIGNFITTRYFFNKQLFKHSVTPTIYR